MHFELFFERVLDTVFQTVNSPTLDFDFTGDILTIRFTTHLMYAQYHQALMMKKCESFCTCVYKEDVVIKVTYDISRIVDYSMVDMLHPFKFSILSETCLGCSKTSLKLLSDVFDEARFKSKNKVIIPNRQFTSNPYLTFETLKLS
jgi:hypothetical protein